MTKVMDKIVTFFSGDLTLAIFMMVLSNTNNSPSHKMQLKLLPILAGAIVTLTTTGFAVQAAPTVLSPILLAQAQEPRGFQGLELTQEQKTRIAQIRENKRSQIEAVLTPQQREQLEAAKQGSRQNKREAFAALNLTPEQKNQMRQIKQSAKTEFEAVLTPEQLQQLQQNRQARRQQRNQ